ncbi:MAG TPA: hypothetical protein VJ828_10745 [Lacipirellulaceae bacterium]|nr:hypothetical protein [Lacipirellulaceae bacterium]
MEPFRVTCETCRARLKVRDESAIGEIHACPKCGSMVQIVPPQGWSAAESPIATAAVLAIVDSAEPDFTHVPPPSDELADRFEAAAAAAVAPVAVTSPAAAVEIAAPPAAFPAAGSPLVLWTVVGAAMILIGGLTAMMWPDGDASNTGPAAPIAAITPTPLVTEPVENDTTANHQDTSSSAQPYAVAKPTSADETSAAADSEPALAASPPNDDANLNAESDEPVDEPLAPVAENSEPRTPSTAAASSGERPAVLKFDPLDFDPSQFSIGTSTPAIPAASSIPEELPDEAASVAGAPTASSNEDSINLSLPAANPTITVRLGPIAEAAQQNDVPEQLALELESLEFTSMPLARFIETLSELSGLPITLDPTALELAGSSARGEVAVTARDATLGQLLQDALRKSRLSFVETDGHVIVALADADRRSSREFNFGDLVDKDSNDAAGVAKLIQIFVAPQSWDVSGGDATIEVNGSKLRIEQRKAVHHEMLLFCERLRLARGLPQKSKYPSELLTIDSPYTNINTRISEKTTFTFLPWTRLADVLRHWQESSGITMLADWHRIADVELEPSTPLACSAIDRTWEDVLDESLEPLGLAWWAVDGSTIQITSLEALDEIHRVEFYEIPKPMRDQFANGNALLETLQAELVEQVGPEAAAAGQLQMQLDKPSRRLIVRGTPPVHRYLAKRLAMQSNGPVR